MPARARPRALPDPPPQAKPRLSHEREGDASQGPGQRNGSNHGQCGHYQEIEEPPVFQRNDGAPGWMGQNDANGTYFTPAFTRFPPEHSAPLHGHHCDEQIIRLRVEGEVEVISR